MEPSTRLCFVLLPNRGTARFPLYFFMSKLADPKCKHTPAGTNKPLFSAHTASTITGRETGKLAETRKSLREAAAGPAGPAGLLLLRQIVHPSIRSLFIGSFIHSHLLIYLLFIHSFTAHLSIHSFFYQPNQFIHLFRSLATYLIGVFLPQILAPYKSSGFWSQSCCALRRTGCPSSPCGPASPLGLAFLRGRPHRHHLMPSHFPPLDTACCHWGWSLSFPISFRGVGPAGKPSFLFTFCGPWAL